MPPFYGQGLYFVTAVDQAWTESKNHNDMLVLKVRVDGEAILRTGADGEPVYDLGHVARNYDRTIRVTLTADSIEMAMKKLRYAGFTGSSFDELNLVGKQFIAVSKEPQSKDGKTYEQWDLALPPLSGGGPPLESKPGVTRKLNALFARQLKEGAGSASAPQTIAPPGGGAAVDEDIPFGPVTI